MAATTLAPQRHARAKRRLTVPARRTEARETLVTAAPYFLRAGADPAPAAPRLLSFDGPGFMDDFLAAVADPATLPALLPWRDWAEPPRGVLEADGTAAYDTTALARAAPIALERDPGVTTADGVPAAAPPWLRKLYLPVHGRFTFAAFDVACQRPGRPPLARGRVLGAGAVVRRMRPRAAAAAPRWEDWVGVDGKRGIWIALAQPIEALDPEALMPAAYAGIEAVVRARLGLAAAPPPPAALDSAKLMLLPPDAGSGDAAKHCTLYGYVPVFSAAEQATDLAGTDTASLVAELQAKAAAAMQDIVAKAPALRAKIGPACAQLLDETVLPPPPATDADAAWTAIAAIPVGFPPLLVDKVEAQAAVDAVLRALLVQGWLALAPATADSGAITATPDSPDGWIDRAQALLQANADTLIAPSTLARSYADVPDLWRVPLVLRLQDLAAAVKTGTPVAPAPGAIAPLDEADKVLLLGCAVLRLRQMRMTLLAALNQQMFGDAGAAALTAQRNGIPVATAGALGDEIEAALGMEAWRGTPQEPGWPPVADKAPVGTNDRRAARAHAAARVLELAFADVEAAGAAAGSAFAQEQDARLDAASASLVARLGLVGPAVLRQAGLEPREQPARGLLALPGPAPDATSLTAAKTAVGNRYTQSAALAEARDTARVPRLRYDHDSLYAVWCWVRVAGRDACEKPRLLWTGPSEPFAIAEPTDVLGAKPATIQLPDIPRLIRDIPRIAKAKARPFAAFAAPPNSSYITGDDAKDTQRAWGVGWICSFGIPVITICAYILLSIILSILIILPSFAWMLLLKFCIPVPVPKKSP